MPFHISRVNPSLASLSSGSTELLYASAKSRVNLSSHDVIPPHQLDPVPVLHSRGRQCPNRVLPFQNLL
jgi:hypothetical protein